MAYFNLNKAKKLCVFNFKELDDVQLQKKIIQLRDYERYTGDTVTYRNILLEGGYFNGVADPHASGLVPKDMFLIQNIKFSLDEALKEKAKRVA